MTASPAPDFDPGAERQSHRRRRVGPCELCDRAGQALTFHHLIPRHCHRKSRFRKMFTLEEMRVRGLWLCRPCHGGIHDLIPDELELGRLYNTREALLGHAALRRHVEWVRKLK